jgi:hypothetical protein
LRRAASTAERTPPFGSSSLKSDYAVSWNRSLQRLDTSSLLGLTGFISVADPSIRPLHIWPRILTTIDGRSYLVGWVGFKMFKHLRGLTAGLSGLDGEELQVAVRLAHNNLHDSKKCFDEFVGEAAPLRILQYSYLHLLFAHMIVSELNKESDRRRRSECEHA